MGGALVKFTHHPTREPKQRAKPTPILMTTQATSHQNPTVQTQLSIPTERIVMQGGVSFSQATTVKLLTMTR